MGRPSRTEQDAQLQQIQGKFENHSFTMARYEKDGMSCMVGCTALIRWASRCMRWWRLGVGVRMRLADGMGTIDKTDS